MNPPNTLWKPKLHFETTDRPSHVTFDDGLHIRRVLPWTHFSEARWERDKSNTIEIEIGDWLVSLRGLNLEPLLTAIGGPTLALVRAFPDFAKERERENDTVVTAIQFARPRPTLVPRASQLELPLKPQP